MRARGISRFALMAALGVDNLGSGLFAPLALMYATRVVGLRLPLASTVVAAGTVSGLLVPPAAGRVVERIGPRNVVIVAQAMQGLGALSYFAAHGVVLTLMASALLASGLQLFYCALYSLIAEVSWNGPKDVPFAVASMVRSASFGLGGLAAAALLAWSGQYRLAAAIDAATFLVAALLLAILVRTPNSGRQSGDIPQPAVRSVLRDRPYVVLIGSTALLALATDFFLVGMPVYVVEQLNGPVWLPGTALALLAGLDTVCGTAAVYATRGRSRTTVLRLSAGCYVGWCVVSVAASLLPSQWLVPWLLGATFLQALATLLFGARANALAEAAAPPGMRRRYLAFFQYAFTIPQFVAPSVVALFAAGIWVPWLVIAAAAAAAGCGLRWLTPRLPAGAARPTAKITGG